MSPTPRPSPLTGAEPLTWWTLTRLLSWTLRWRISRTSTRWLLAGFVAVATTATTIYLSVHRVQLATAALVRKISDHVARRPGQREASDFRRRVFAHLAEEADRARYASSPTLVEILVDRYIEDLPGLRVVRRHRTRTGYVWCLERPPRGGET